MLKAERAALMCVMLPSTNLPIVKCLHIHSCSLKIISFSRQTVCRGKFLNIFLILRESNVVFNHIDDHQPENCFVPHGFNTIRENSSSARIGKCSKTSKLTQHYLGVLKTQKSCPSNCSSWKTQHKSRVKENWSDKIHFYSKKLQPFPPSIFTTISIYQ